MKKLISVTYHANPKKKVHTYWFTDEEKAHSFIDSLKRSDNVLDYRAFATYADIAEEYSDSLQDVPVQMIG